MKTRTSMSNYELRLAAFITSLLVMFAESFKLDKACLEDKEKSEHWEHAAHATHLCSIVILSIFMVEGFWF